MCILKDLDDTTNSLYGMYWNVFDTVKGDYYGKL